MSTTKTFGKNLGKILEDLGKTQAWLAVRADCTPAAISLIVTGKRDPTLTTVVKILSVIPTTFEKLMDNK